MCLHFLNKCLHKRHSVCLKEELFTVFTEFWCMIVATALWSLPVWTGNPGRKRTWVKRRLKWSPLCPICPSCRPKCWCFLPRWRRLSARVRQTKTPPPSYHPSWPRPAPKLLQNLFLLFTLVFSSSLLSFFLTFMSCFIHFKNKVKHLGWVRTSSCTRK